LTLAFFTAYFVCQVGGVIYGTGKHMEDLDPTNAETALHFWWFCELFYILASSWLKLAVGVFLLRVATNRTHIWIIRAVIAGTALFGAVYFFLAIFQCKPVSAWWKHMPGYGTCLGPNIVLATTYTSSALNSFADWTFGILPFFIVKDLDMPRKHKRQIAGILAFAAIGCLATIIRMPFIMALARADDFLWETVDIAIWSTVEPGVGISAACVATLRPLLQVVVRNPNKATSRRHTKQSQQSRSYALSQGLPTLRPDFVGNYTEITSAGIILSNKKLMKDIGSAGAGSDDPPTLVVAHHGLPDHTQMKNMGITKSVEVTCTETELDMEDSLDTCFYDIRSANSQGQGLNSTQRYR